MLLSALLLLGPCLLVVVIMPSGTSTGADVRMGDREADTGLWWHIISTNISTALTLLTGVLTFGLSTAVIAVLVGMVLGHSMGTSVEMLGMAEVAARTWAYTPLELAGFLLAAAAGLRPLVGVLVGVDHEHGTRGIARAVALLSGSARLFGFAVLTLLAASVVELLSIHLSAGS